MGSFRLGVSTTVHQEPKTKPKAEPKVPPPPPPKADDKGPDGWNSIIDVMGFINQLFFYWTGTIFLDKIEKIGQEPYFFFLFFCSPMDYGDFQISEPT